ncbi:hypothetical protein BT69DRAFT_1346586 [Atractiella rhizophila]|nr:hypothetical protein BT69DRAFT_1346586 [Atractiella rhizophila]
MSAAFFVLGPCGQIAPHSHPRGTEFLYLIAGGPMRFGINFEAGGPVAYEFLQPGQAVMLPAGSMHYGGVLGCDPSVVIAMFNSEDPGFQLTNFAFFGFDNEAISASLGQAGATILDPSTFPNALNLGFESCRAQCNLPDDYDISTLSKLQVIEAAFAAFSERQKSGNLDTTASSNYTNGPSDFAAGLPLPPKVSGDSTIGGYSASGNKTASANGTSKAKSAGISSSSTTSTSSNTTTSSSSQGKIAPPAGVLANDPSLAYVGAGATQSPDKICEDIFIPVDVNIANVDITFPTPADAYDLHDFFTEYVSNKGNTSAHIGKNPNNINTTYTLGATLCTPTDKSAGKWSTIFHLSHGPGFDRRFYDLYTNDPTNTTYSFVNALNVQGYSTLALDLLGVGASDTPDGITDVQFPVFIEMAHQINLKLKAGQIGSNATQYQNIVHVGHASGSSLGNGLMILHPDDLAASIFTGYSHNATAVRTFFSNYNPQIPSQGGAGLDSSVSGADNSYIVFGNQFNLQTAFFKRPQYEKSVVNAVYARRAPFPIGGLFTVGTTIAAAPNYTGAVMFVTGQNDLPFCGGFCGYGDEYVLRIEPGLFKAAKDVTTYSPVLTGHGAFFHTNFASDVLPNIWDFLSRNGL